MKDPFWFRMVKWLIKNNDEIEDVLDYGGIFFRIPFVIILSLTILPFAWIDERRTA